MTLKVQLAETNSEPANSQGLPGPFEVMVIDDGIGTGNASLDTRGGGRGLANMRARAEAIGGRFTLESSPSGSIARLRVRTY